MFPNALGRPSLGSSPTHPALFRANFRCHVPWSLQAEFGFKPNPKMADQLGYALKQGIPYLVLFGDSEIEQVGLSGNPLLILAKLSVSAD